MHSRMIARTYSYDADSDVGSSTAQLDSLDHFGRGGLSRARCKYEIGSGCW